MKKLPVYEYKSYKKFLLDWIALTPANGRGQRKELAHAVGCQTPFVTQVLSGDYHFSLEQAEACARWLGLGMREAEFFVLLVLKQRAATKTLESFLERQLAERRQSEQELTNRLKISDTLSAEDHIVYYSSWHYAAVHMALLNPNLQSLEQLHVYFSLPFPRLKEILEFLTTKRLVRTRAGRYEVLLPAIHLGRDSPLLAKHHANWRLRAIEAIESASPENFHYSGVISLSKDDYEWVKSRLGEALEEVIAKLKDSPDEKIGCLSLDLFGL